MIMHIFTSLSDIELPEAEKIKIMKRIILFISIAIFAMSGTKGCNHLYMPENGLIALNVPLDSTRMVLIVRELHTLFI